MSRRKKQNIKLNNVESLESIVQETYSDACLQIIDTQKMINELSTSANVPEDNNVDDLTKIAREKSNLLKVKDSAIKIKLEIAKLQSDIIKNNGDVKSAIDERSNSSVSVNDFKAIREMIKNNKSDLDN